MIYHDAGFCCAGSAVLFEKGEKTVFDAFNRFDLHERRAQWCDVGHVFQVSCVVFAEREYRIPAGL